MDDLKQINFQRVEGMWRAYIAGEEIYGGMAETPEEALGMLLLRYPRKMGVGCFSWISRPPARTNYEFPSGPQTTF